MSDRNAARRNVAIQYIRVLAMLLIFMDHSVAYMDIPMKSVLVQIGNSANFLFLMVSGFLYGGKTIENAGKWIKTRILRLMLPCWVFLAFYFGLKAIEGHFSFRAAVVYGLALQGLLGTENGPHTLWFLTLLMFCYALIPLLQTIRRKARDCSKMRGSLVCLFVFAVQVLLAAYCPIRLDFGHTLSWYAIALVCFSGAYLLHDAICRWADDALAGRKHILRVVLLVGCAAMLRVTANIVADGSFVYDLIIAPWTNAVINAGLFIFVYIVATQHAGRLDNKWIAQADRLSYPFYLVHGTVLEYSAGLAALPLLFLSVGFGLSAVCAMAVNGIAQALRSGMKYLKK